MSRVEEALKRVSGVAVPHHDAPSGRSVGTGGGRLEHYPEENRSPAAAVAARPALAVRPPTAHIVAPRAGRRSQLGGFDPNLNGKLVITRDAEPVSIEQFRRLAATLHEARLDRSVRSLMITSAAPKEGKTLTTSNLALTLSESYHLRVLLIDADLRRPSVHEVFGIPNTGGLSESLRSDTAPMSLVEVSPHLTLLTAGRPDPNPMAVLTSTRMINLISEAVTRFDWVLVDTPPVGLLSDANLLARLVDAVLFVIGAGVTPYPIVQRAIAELGTDRIIGTILNRAEATELTTNDYYRDYHADGRERAER